MTTTPAPAGAAARSRLEPEPLPRRDFLGLSAAWSALAALLFGFFGAARLPRAAVVPVAARKFKVALPPNLAPGEAFLPPGRSVAIFQDDQGVFALSRICTHLGCLVKSDAAGFQCPCHGSRYAPDGSVLKGPAPKALPWLAVKRVAAGTYLVDESKIVPAGTKETA
ncbi:MAG: ubiquinol-cytochrome c reductase iron-sulfur subunit [Candidatus Binatia bacterium]